MPVPRQWPERSDLPSYATAVTKRGAPCITTGFSLGLLMRAQIGCGTPRGWADAWLVTIWTEHKPRQICLGLMLCRQNQSCLFLTLTFIHIRD